MKFGQLIEYNVRNIFLQKSYTKQGGETSPRHFSAKLKLIKSQYNIINSLKLLINSLKFYTVCFYCNLS